MVKYILQHIGPTDYDYPRKVSKEKIDKLIDSGIISFEGKDEEIGGKVTFQNVVVPITIRRLKELYLEDYIYANENEDSMAHFLRGVSIGNKISEIEMFLSENDKQNLLNIFPNGMVKFWGIKNGENHRTKRKFLKIEKEDRFILISTHGIEAVCEVAYKIARREVGQILWNDSDYENIVFLKNINRMVDFNISTLKKILNLSDDYNRISMHIFECGDSGFLELDCEMDKILLK